MRPPSALHLGRLLHELKQISLTKPFVPSAPLLHPPNTHFHTGLSFGFVLPPLRTHSLHTSQVWLHSVRSAHRCWRAVWAGVAYATSQLQPKAPEDVFMSPLPLSSLRRSLSHTQPCVLPPSFSVWLFSLSSAGGVQKPAAGVLKYFFFVFPDWWFYMSL